MKDAGMKSARFLVIAIFGLTNLSVLAQQVDAHGDPNVYANAGTAQGTPGFGDEATSRSWEMSAVTGELQGKLDSKTAKDGDPVVLKTTAKVQTSDGTIIAKGSRLTGHITEVQAHNSERAVAQIGMVFDHVELKNGQSIAVHTLIRTAQPAPSVAAMSSMANEDDSMSVTQGGGGLSGVGQAGGGAGGMSRTGANSGGLGTATNTAGNLGGTGNLGGVAARTPNVNGQTAGGLAAPINPNPEGEVQLAGHGDSNLDRGAHAAPAAQTRPHATGFPGVMLAGTSSNSGLFISSDRHEVEFSSGIQMQLGIVRDR
jgi:hypothetical protein